MSEINPALLELFTRHHGDQSGFSRHYLTLYSVALGLEAREVFEFGSGFSTEALLAALERTGGHLTTCDQRPIEGTGNSPALLTQHAGRFTYLQGDSRQEVAKVADQKFDLVLHDGSHEWRVVYRDLRNILPHIKQDGVILVHDTEHVPTYRLKLAVWLALLFVRHKKVTLPYGYGLTIIRIYANYGNGRVDTSWTKDRKKKNLPV